ncbi:PAS domain-containing protein [Aquimarina mytili]|uniref:PAS domain-containing protein n=1 Tax=Aquimarina mytili TaxID=874423 RepID=A0A936ZXM4_9FLAO|nr:PAS domain-containing protein [Aquimarina mytili]MBL0684156.1 PAS domain-containing protein [Aquimarina mytili]
MEDFKGYDQMMAGYYKKMSNYTLPLLSWEFLGEHHTTLETFKEDLNVLKKLTKNWDFTRNYHKEFTQEESVIIITKPNLKIVYASQNIQELNGYEPNEVIGQTPKMFQGAGTCQRTSAKVRDAVNNKTPFEVSILNYRKDKTTYKCIIKGFPVYDKKGKLINYIAFEKAA